jgi:hypothetical protein
VETGEFGARADQAHVAEKHIEYLGELVEFPAAEEWADGGEGLVGGGGEGRPESLFVGNRHGAELIDGEGAVVASDALLAEEGGSAGGEADGDGCGDEDGQSQGKTAEDTGDIEEALGVGLSPAAQARPEAGSICVVNLEW